MNTTVYGIDLSNKRHLRPSLISGSQEGQKRLEEITRELSGKQSSSVMPENTETVPPAGATPVLPIEESSGLRRFLGAAAMIVHMALGSHFVEYRNIEGKRITDKQGKEYRLRLKRKWWGRLYIVAEAQEAVGKMEPWTVRQGRLGELYGRAITNKNAISFVLLQAQSPLGSILTLLKGRPADIVLGFNLLAAQTQEDFQDRGIFAGLMWEWANLVPDGSCLNIEIAHAETAGMLDKGLDFSETVFGKALAGTGFVLQEKIKTKKLWVVKLKKTQIAGSASLPQVPTVPAKLSSNELLTQIHEKERQHTVTATNLNALYEAREQLNPDEVLGVFSRQQQEVAQSNEAVRKFAKKYHDELTKLGYGAKAMAPTPVSTLHKTAPQPVIIDEVGTIIAGRSTYGMEKLEGFSNRRIIFFTEDIINVGTFKYAITGSDAVNPILGTVGAYTCMILILYDPVSCTGFLGHFPSISDGTEKRFIDKVLKKLGQRGVMDITKLQAKLLGGSGGDDVVDADGTVKDRVENILNNRGIKDIKREDISNEVSKTAAIDVRTGEIFDVVQDERLAEKYNKDRQDAPLAESIFDLTADVDFKEFAAHIPHAQPDIHIQKLISMLAHDETIDKEIEVIMVRSAFYPKASHFQKYRFDMLVRKVEDNSIVAWAGIQRPDAEAGDIVQSGMMHLGEKEHAYAEKAITLLLLSYAINIWHSSSSLSKEERAMYGRLGQDPRLSVLDDDAGGFIVTRKEIPLTYFGRDGHTLIRTVEHAIEHLEDGEECNILTLGSSSGEEGYDVAMAIAEYMEKTGRKLKVNLIISDVNPHLVEYSQTGIYNTAEVRTPQRTSIMTDDLTREETEDRYKKFFRAVSAYRSQILRPEEFKSRWGINIRFEVIDITNQGHMDRAASGNKFDLVVARNVDYVLSKILMQQVLYNIERVLKDNGFVSINYGISPYNEDDTLKEASISLLTKQDMGNYKAFRKKYFNADPNYGPDIGALSLKLSHGIAKRVKIDIREHSNAYFPRDLTNVLDTLGEAVGGFPRRSSYALPVLTILFVDEDIDNEARDCIFQWMRSQSKQQGNYPVTIIYMLEHALNYMQEKTYEVLFNKAQTQLKMVKLEGFENQRIFHFITDFTRTIVRQRPDTASVDIHKLLSAIFENFMGLGAETPEKVDRQARLYRFNLFTDSLIRRADGVKTESENDAAVYQYIKEACNRLLATGNVIVRLEAFEGQLRQDPHAFEGILNRVIADVKREHPKLGIDGIEDVDMGLISKACKLSQTAEKETRPAELNLRTLQTGL